MVGDLHSEVSFNTHHTFVDFWLHLARLFEHIHEAAKLLTKLRYNLGCFLCCTMLLLGQLCCSSCLEMFQPLHHLPFNWSMLSHRGCCCSRCTARRH